MTKAYIFDLDGTLINSLEDLAEGINRMLDERGYPRHPLDVFPKYIGEGVRSLVECAIPADKLAEEDVDARVRDYQRHYQVTWNLKTRPYEGISEVLFALKERGAAIGVLSNKQQDFTTLCCEHFFPDAGFFDVRGAREGVARKPAPDAALLMIEQLGLKPEECAYIGDSGLDMEMATRAGMKAVGVLWGFRDEEELRANGAQFLISKPIDLLTLDL